jgi:hypothetical protein
MFDAIDADFETDLMALFGETAINLQDNIAINNAAKTKYTVNRGIVIAAIET